MATNNLQTDKYASTPLPANTVSTDEWVYNYSVAIVAALRTDKWYFALSSGGAGFLMASD